MEMISIAGLFFLFIFLVCGSIVSLRLKKTRPFVLGCLLPGTAVFLLLSGCAGKYLFLDEPLYTASNKGDIRTVHRLLARGADPNSDFEDNSALSAAARGGHRAVVALLIEHGAKVNTKEHAPPLNAAVEAGQTEIVRILLQHGANVATKDSWSGWTPLQTAKVKGYAEIKQILVHAGAQR